MFLTNCSGVKSLSIFKEEVKRQELNLNKPDPLVLERIKWHIITSENAAEVFAKLEAEGIDPVLFGLTDKDFQLIAKNFAQIRNQLKVTNELLDKYLSLWGSEIRFYCGLPKQNQPNLNPPEPLEWSYQQSGMF